MHVIATQENDMLLFDITLPNPGAADVVSRELTIKIGDQPAEVIVLAADAVTASSKGPQDTTLTISLVDIDDGGNRSEARVQDFVLSDTIPPPQPGELGVTVTGEE
jgi:hypothetical protein